MFLTRSGTRAQRLGTSIFGLSLLATLGAAGCTSAGHRRDRRRRSQHPPPPAAAGTSIPFEVFTDDVGTQRRHRARASLIRTSQGYVSFFGHAPPAGVDSRPASG